MAEPYSVLLVDPIGNLEDVRRLLHDDEAEYAVERVDTPEKIDPDASAPDCVIVLSWPDRGVDGLARVEQLRTQFPDTPTMIIGVDPSQTYVQDVIQTSVDDVVTIGRDDDLAVQRGPLLRRRIRSLIGQGEEFRSDSELLSTVLRHLPHQVFIKDDVGRYAAVSEAKAVEHDLSIDDMVGLTDFEMFRWEMAVGLANEETHLKETDSSMVDRVEEYTDPEGRRRWVSVSKVPRYDMTGEVVGLIGTARDVTKQEQHKRMARALHGASRELIAAETPTEIAEVTVDIARDIPDTPAIEVVLRSDLVGDVAEQHRDSETKTTEVAGVEIDVVDTSPGSTHAADESLVSVASGFEAASIYDRHEEWVRRTFTRQEPQLLFVDEDESTVVCRAAATAHEDIVPSTTLLPLGEYGVLAFTAATGSLDEFAIDYAEVLATIVESALETATHEAAIREHERELVKQNERLEEFASIVSHDLRNPLSIAQGYAEMIDAETAAVADVRELLDHIDELTSDLLELACTDEIASDIQELPIDEAASEAWAALSSGDAQLSIDDTVPTIDGDRSRVIELLERCFQFALENGADGPASVSVGPIQSGLYVTARGLRVTPADRSVLEDGAVPDGEGSLGLYVVATIAAAHGWEISITEGEDGDRIELRTVASDPVHD